MELLDCYPHESASMQLSPLANTRHVASSAVFFRKLVAMELVSGHGFVAVGPNLVATSMPSGLVSRRYAGVVF